ncbi:MAG: tripartite tricarboxylate transporter substrate binding protein [Candidatus Ornithospirochaeta sp.]|nr:tripartite tricarboxylate transporter substrate binding protein [Sphaerochaetaceae bacterium]MDY5522828.1 tripartite tricarboxylate transporter substrate binding protein [Candidatus Ornithospirochaeta sp.]
MKKFVAIVLSALMVCALFANGTEETASAGFKPTKDVSWVCTSKPGGGSDIFTTQIKDAMKVNGITDANIVTEYITDGSGEVGRLQVSTTNKAKADYTLLTFNSGDLMPMVKNTDNRVENFRPLAIMAVDKQLLFVGEQSKYSSWQEIMDALKSGAKIVIAGSKGDDIETYSKLIAELGVSEAQLSYIANDATSGAITSLLGGHVDLCMSKPAAASQYVEAGKMKPVLALSTTRFSTESLKDAPTLSEFGFNNVEVPVWRGVSAPKAMSDEAYAFWADCLKKASETAEFKAYLAKNGLEPMYLFGAEAEAYMLEYQKNYLVSIGK